MRIEWSNKDSLEIPEITAGYGSVSWSDYKTGTSCDSVVLWIPNEQHYYARYCLFCGARMNEEKENETN